MGLRFRKSYGKGPFRLNVSKSGVGYSVGAKGFRVTKKADGGTRTTASIPGTGISYVNESGKKRVVPSSNATAPTAEKSKTTTLILACLLGWLGIHRFYTGKTGTGVIWLFTLGLCCIGWIVDIVRVASGYFTDKYGRPLK